MAYIESIEARAARIAGGAVAVATWRTTTSGAGVRQCNRRNYNTDTEMQRRIAYCLASPTLGIELQLSADQLQCQLKYFTPITYEY